jgi:hypothetical protein
VSWGEGLVEGGFGNLQERCPAFSEDGITAPELSRGCPSRMH